MRVLKWDVPVDAQPHIVGTGRIVLVAAQGVTDVVQVWTIEGDNYSRTRVVQVWGTGHNVPDGWRHVGSTLAIPFVWHLFEQVQF